MIAPDGGFLLPDYPEHNGEIRRWACRILSSLTKMALKIDPKNPETWNGLGWASFEPQ